MTQPESEQIEKIFALLIDHSTVRHKGVAGVFTGWDGSLMLGYSINFFICFVLASLGKAHIGPQFVLLRLFAIFYLLGLISVMALVFRQIYSSGRYFTQPVASFLRLRLEPVKRDFEFLLALKELPNAQLRFIHARLEKEADHFRGRIGVIIGALDRVGLVPLAAGAIVSGWRFAHDAHFRPGYLEVLVTGAGCCYLMGAAFTLASHRIDELAQLVELARSE